MKPNEIRASVAGQGRGTATAGLHFCDAGDNCVLSIGRAIHGFQSGEGATNAETKRVTAEVNSGVLTMDVGVVKIAVDAPVRAKPSLAKRIQPTMPTLPEPPAEEAAEEN